MGRCQGSCLCPILSKYLNQGFAVVIVFKRGHTKAGLCIFVRTRRPGIGIPGTPVQVFKLSTLLIWGNINGRNKTKIISIIRDKIDRVEPEKLINYLEEKEFFEQPASTKYHNSFEGGLAKHSLNVYNEFKKLNEELELGYSDETVAVVSLLHDLCKAGSYIKVPGGYKYNKSHKSGHGELSVTLIKDLMPLSMEEENMILYHMGAWYCKGVHYKPEYSVRELIKAYKAYNNIRYFYFADELATKKEDL